MNPKSLSISSLTRAVAVAVFAVAGVAGCSSDATSGGDSSDKATDGEKVPAECLEAIDAAHKRILTNDRAIEAALTYHDLVSSAYLAALTADNNELSDIADQMDETNETVAGLTEDLKADGFEDKHSACLDASDDLPDVCETALDEIGENIRLTNDYVNTTKNLPILVGEAADAAVTSSESDDSEVLDELEETSDTVGPIKAKIDEGEFSLYASKCRALNN